MVISRTPFRISFMGGGTDLPDFYKEEEGMVVSTAINKFMHITVNYRFDSTFRLSYSKTEITEAIEKIEHPIFRSVLRRYYSEKKDRGLELISMADLPAGTGLGSSSSFTVALLHAINAILNRKPSAEDLAREACWTEIEDLKEPIGKQDQYIAAYGGLCSIRFLPDGRVITEPIRCSDKTYADLEASVLIFYTGQSRSASEILQEQKGNTSTKRHSLREMKKGALECKRILEEKGDIKAIGELLHRGWLLKKSLATKISSVQIDQWYESGLEAGAWGGKILGAGGGGFLMFLCHPEKQSRVCSALSELRQIKVNFERSGSRIIFVD